MQKGTSVAVRVLTGVRVMLIVRNLFAFDRIHVVISICSQPIDFSVRYLLTGRNAPAVVSAA